jgi:NodT family efflux transporter outer membrane factor (OMF) lipoprotein
MERKAMMTAMVKLRARTLPRTAVVTVLLTSAVLLGGCARIRPAQPEIVALTSWSAAGPDTVQSPTGDLSQWWTRLGDPVLSDLIAQALNKNTSLRTAQANLREARAERNYAAANRFPTITGTASGSGSQSNSPGGSGENVFSAELDASWDPDVFGAKRQALRAADADLATSAADLQTVQVSLIAELATDYVDLRSYQTRLEIARRNQASQAETLQLTEWRAQAGLVSSIDVEQARSNLEQTRAAIPTLETSSAQSKHELSVLLGLTPGELNPQLATTAPIPSAPDTLMVGIPAETLRQRPDVRAAEQKIVAETARLWQKNAARYPTFSLSGSFILEQLLGGTALGVVTGSTFTSLTADTTATGSGLGSITQTFFDRGRIRQQIEIQNAVQEQAVISYESTVLTALKDVENALVSFQNSRQRLQALNQASEAARNAARLAQNRYSAGLIDFQTVLDTERTALTIEDSVAQTQADRTTSLIQLYKALGGGWQADVTVVTARKQGNQT